MTSSEGVKTNSTRLSIFEPEPSNSSLINTTTSTAQSILTTNGLLFSQKKALCVETICQIIETPQGEYEGGWLNDKPFGYGTMRYSAVRQYEGYWIEGRRNGFGLDTRNGKTYFERWSFGTCEMVIGAYQGQTEKGVPKGKGFINYTTGGSYFGDWQRGLRHGYGAAIDNFGNSWVGTWNEDKLVEIETFTAASIAIPHRLPPESIAPHQFNNYALSSLTPVPTPIPTSIHRPQGPDPEIPFFELPPPALNRLADQVSTDEPANKKVKLTPSSEEQSG